jgi:proteasome lid subunit RPN8/RPN11
MTGDKMLKIPERIFKQMVLQGRAVAPVEACGILAGRDGIVVKCFEMTNADNSAEHFTMVPEEQFAVAKDMRAAGLEMAAVYHTHPATPARPSQEDIKLAVMPGAVYVILSLVDPDEPIAKAFAIEDGVVNNLDLEIVKD